MFYISAGHAGKVMRHYPAGVIAATVPKAPAAGCLNYSDSKNHYSFYKNEHGILYQSIAGQT